MLEHAGCTVTVAHSKTTKDSLIENFVSADILVSAVGKRNVVSDAELLPYKRFKDKIFL